MVFAVKCWIENTNVANDIFFNIKNVWRDMPIQILIIKKYKIKLK